jgi:DNA-binding response OmpR family regulator
MASVLVIENDVPAMRLMTWGLMEEGLEVGMAHVPDAVERLRERAPDIIVFNTLKRTDEKARLVREFRAVAPLARIIDVSERAEGDISDIGADAQLTLPLKISELVETIEALSQN